jgi:hypothetical protein
LLLISYTHCSETVTERVLAVSRSADFGGGRKTIREHASTTTLQREGKWDDRWQHQRKQTPVKRSWQTNGTEKLQVVTVGDGGEDRWGASDLSIGGVNGISSPGGVNGGGYSPNSSKYSNKSGVSGMSTGSKVAIVVDGAAHSTISEESVLTSDAQGLVPQNSKSVWRRWTQGQRGVTKRKVGHQWLTSLPQSGAATPNGGNIGASTGGACSRGMGEGEVLLLSGQPVLDGGLGELYAPHSSTASIRSVTSSGYHPNVSTTNSTKFGPQGVYSPNASKWSQTSSVVGMSARSAVRLATREPSRTSTGPSGVDSGWKAPYKHAAHWRVAPDCFSHKVAEQQQAQALLKPLELGVAPSRGLLVLDEGEAAYAAQEQIRGTGHQHTNSHSLQWTNELQPRVSNGMNELQPRVAGARATGSRRTGGDAKSRALTGGSNGLFSPQKAQKRYADTPLGKVGEIKWTTTLLKTGLRQGAGLEGVAAKGNGRPPSSQQHEALRPASGQPDRPIIIPKAAAFGEDLVA